MPRRKPPVDDGAVSDKVSAMGRDTRSEHEILHGQRLAETGNPELAWNWDTPAGKHRAQRRGQLLSEAAGLRPGVRVLEIGCGTGLFTEMLAERGADVLAVDISPDLIDIARRKEMPGRIEWRVARFEDLEVEEPFDAVVGSSILHHLDMKVALRHIYKLLRPGGRIAFAEPNMLNPQIWAERHLPTVRERSLTSPDETAIVRWTLAGELKRIGFTAVRIQNVDWLHPATPPALIPFVSRGGRWLERVPLLREFSGSVLIRAERPAATTRD